MKILLIGDIVGRTGRRAVRELLPNIIEKEKPDFIIANGENAAGGFGLTEGVMDELLDYNIDLLTTGNHVWDNKDIFNFIDESDKVIRPYNYPQGVPGVGYKVIKKGQYTLGVINLMGRVFLGDYDCPFRSVDQLIDELKEKVDGIVIDFHAEATAEKEAFGWYVDGRVSLVAGTHTHVQTADERVLPGGTAYITDLGLTGGIDSILGMNIDEPLNRFLTQLPNRFKVAKGDTKLSGLIVQINSDNGLATSVKRVCEVYKNN
ncbi:TIGR00282 family metallophosphoesterase [Halonatronum saccharophilum]|uniref:TIGR00282 family metallophosphoesterase n=1 Tax=Halonatronum saccharophilum TaxID=150060 RepID=UPI0004898D5C|nr:TIGR00282 family metallophosphoesterase [Halonatronum saccharophilum]